MAQYVCIDCGERFEPAPSLEGPQCPRCGSRQLRIAGAMQWQLEDDPSLEPYDPAAPCAT
jgi:Zn finger protein HypA/HybF involved in hydrogenase expression